MNLIEILFSNKDIKKLLQKAEVEGDKLFEKIVKQPQPQKT